MINISYLRACNVLYSNLSTQTRVQVSKTLLSDAGKKSTRVCTKATTRPQTTTTDLLTGFQIIPRTFLKNRYFYNIYTGKIQKMNSRYGNVFIINRAYSSSSSRHANLSSNKVTNLYDVLGVSPNAKAAEIKSAFYRLSKTYHPDINKTEEAATRFAEILSAYEILGNLTKRRMYDRGAMMHPRFGASPQQRGSDEPDRRKRPMRPGGVGQRPEGAGPYRDFTDASGRPAFKFDTDFQDYYTSSRDNRIFTQKESEFFMKRHHEDEKSRRSRGIFTGIFVFTFLGLAFLSKQIDHRREENRQISFISGKK